MTRTEVWIWAGVAAVVLVAVVVTKLAGSQNWLLPLVPLGVGWTFWTVLCWLDRRNARRERDRRG